MTINCNRKTATVNNNQQNKCQRKYQELNNINSNKEIKKIDYIKNNNIINKTAIILLKTI
jgi:hypothetical protein